VPAIETRELTKRFGSLVAVDRLDLTVDEGEIFGFLGPNGAGKTTTTRLLLDALRPTSGSATVLGGAPGDLAVRSRIGVLPADLHFEARLTGRGLFDFLGDLRGDFEPAEVGGLCERFQLDPTRRIDELSTGNKRKVGIVAAFAHRPDLLILDEPTSGLDPLMQAQFHALVRERRDEGATVFLSSHLLPEVQEMAERVGLIKEGHLVEVKSVQELLEQHSQRLVLEFADPVADDAFAAVDHVTEVTIHGTTATVVVDGPVHPALRRAAELRAVHIRTDEADLEDVFLELYR
jgi:ABC-2 type transport system ATP-binding protein